MNKKEWALGILAVLAIIASLVSIAVSKTQPVANSVQVNQPNTISAGGASGAAGTYEQGYLDSTNDYKVNSGTFTVVSKAPGKVKYKTDAVLSGRYLQVENQVCFSEVDDAGYALLPHMLQEYPDASMCFGQDSLQQFGFTPDVYNQPCGSEFGGLAVVRLKEYTETFPSSNTELGGSLNTAVVAEVLRNAGPACGGEVSL